MKFNFFRKGYEIIWKTIVKKENLNIEFNQDIFAVERKFNKIILPSSNDLYIDLLSGNSFKSDNGEIEIDMPPMSGLILK